MNILINLYGEEFREDFDEHLALLKEINDYHRRKRADIEKEALNDWINNNIILREAMATISEDDSSTYYFYSTWFKNVFITDYNLALKEVEQQTIPSDRELCILRLAREAVYKYVDADNLYKFCKEYLIDITEYSIFWNEYYYCKQYQNSSTGWV